MMLPSGWFLSAAGALDIGLRTAAVYVALLLGLRLSGKREIGQMTAFDLVVLLLLSNAVQNAMVGPDTTVPGGLVAALVLFILDAGISQLTVRVPRLRRLLQGTPTVLVSHGVVIQENLRREGIDLILLEAALREHGVEKAEDTEIVVLEVDGSISVVPKGQPVRRTRKPLKYLRRN